MLLSCFKKLFLLLLISVLAFTIKAQQPHFIYLQTDNGQLFYVKLNNKVVSSSSEGYIILPGLTDGKYELVVGFPKNEFPEEKFDLTIDKKNEGFLLKNFDEKGWQLFNLQTLALIEGTRDQSIAVTDSVKRDTDPFSKMLAGVVKDSSILQNHQPSASAVQANTSADSLKSTDSIALASPVSDTALITANTKNTDSAAAPVLLADSSMKNESSVTIEKIEPEMITRILRNEGKEGLQMIYQDRNGNNIDTVRIIFPIPGNSVPADTVQHVQSAGLNIPDSVSAIPQNSVAENAGVHDLPAVADNTPAVIADTGKVVPTNVEVKLSVDSLPKLPDSSLAANSGVSSISSIKDTLQQVANNEKLPPENVTGQKDTLVEKENTKQDSNSNNESRIFVLPKPVTSSRVNSDCKDFATDQDFLKLRKKMAAESNKDDMIKVAKKYFKAKCFSTEQIKDLSYLFLTDEGKYMFFDAAYPFTSDSNQYETLQSQFTDDYYLNRFKAMIRK